MGVLVFSASLRKDSLNHKLAVQTARMVEAAGGKPELMRMNDFDMPFFDADLFTSKGLPAGAEKLADMITGTDGMILSSPEYNWGVPATIKNAIDWLSRMDPNPLRHRTVLLCSAAPSPVGGVRGLLHLRDSFETLSAFAYPRLLCLPKADEAFSEDGSLKDAALVEEFQEIVADYLRFAAAVKSR
jgi:chromate reductase